METTERTAFKEDATQYDNSCHNRLGYAGEKDELIDQAQRQTRITVN